MKNICAGVCLLLSASVAFADGDFGTENEARTIAASMSEVITTNGLDAAIAAMHDSSYPFSTSDLGIHVFEQGVIVADNREPELTATSYVDLADLTGDSMWPRITSAADAQSDAILEWYHYDTEAEYSYKCYSEWAQASEVLVMVCR